MGGGGDRIVKEQGVLAIMGTSLRVCGGEGFRGRGRRRRRRRRKGIREVIQREWHGRQGRECQRCRTFCMVVYSDPFI